MLVRRKKGAAGTLSPRGFCPMPNAFLPSSCDSLARMEFAHWNNSPHSPHAERGARKPSGIMEINALRRRRVLSRRIDFPKWSLGSEAALDACLSWPPRQSVCCGSGWKTLLPTARSVNETLDRAENRDYDASKENSRARRSSEGGGGRVSLVVCNQARCKCTGSLSVWCP